MKSVSVIIPVYNSAGTLRACVDSVLRQTLPPKEILLIDDGSEDGSGELCDALAMEQNGLIFAFHKRNGGAASARNVGLEQAKGELLAFVDSDDFIEREMLEHLSSLMARFGADIAACEMAQEKKGESYCRTPQTPVETVKCFSTEEALIELCSCRYFYESVCTALFSRALFEGLRFQEGRTCEDHAILHELFARSRAVVYSSRALYHYNQHIGSVSRAQTLHLDTVAASRDRLSFFERNQPELLYAAKGNYAVSCMSAYTDSVREGVRCPPTITAQLRRECRRAMPGAIRNGRLPLIKKLQLCCFCTCLPIYRAIIARTEHR